MASMNLQNDMQKVEIDSLDKMLGKGLQMPFNASNSGSRKLMFGTQLEQRLPLIHPDVAFIQTGYEMEFGKHSSSYVKLDTGESLEVIACIPKFSKHPRHHYFIFARDKVNGIIRLFERKEYKHITENYGYLFNNEYLDSLSVGDMIPKGTVIQTSMAVDEYDNRMDGKNLLTIYNSCEETMEDAIIISESASKKLASPLIKKVTIVINDNDIPINLYGDMNTYKIFPDIGEETSNSILCALRREKKEECLFSQSYARLRTLSISDEKYTVSGRVVDIDVRCNAPDKLAEFDYNAQLKEYYDDNLRFAAEVVNLLNPLSQGGWQFDYNLEKLFSICNGVLAGKQYFAERVFSNIVLEITLIEEIPVRCGDKLSNRYGGKGITARVKPDALMPRTMNGDVVDIILNMCGVYGRENAGQLFELTISHICMRLIDYINYMCPDVGACIDIYLDLLKIVAPSMVEYTENLLSQMTDDEAIEYISNTCLSEKSLYLVIEPMSENMTIDKVKQLYETFSWIKPQPMLMPIVDSAGEIKYIPSRRPIVYGYQYIYRLKQYAEEKFSATSLSATNIRNENSKSKSSNNYKALYSRTPIRFGDMETGNLIHLGASLVVQNLMLYSTSPHARRLTEQLLTGDPFNVNIELDMESKNRNAEILNVYLKTMGLKLVFKRLPKKKPQAILTYPIIYTSNTRELPTAIMPIHPDEKFDIEAEVERMLKSAKDDGQWAIEVYPMEFFKLKDEKYLDEDEDDTTNKDMGY